MLSEQTDAFWPFTASQRSSNVPEPQPVASTNVPAVSTLEFPPHVMNGYDYRSAPGFFEFPNFQAYLKQFPVVYHQQQQQEDETQQTEQTPDNSGTKGGSGSTDGGTKGGTGTKGTPVRNGFFSRFWRYGRPVAKEDYVKPEVIEPVASADTTGTVVNVQDGDTVFVSEPMAVDPANVQFGNSGFLESAPNPKHPGKLMPWNWVFWNQEQQQGQQGPELLSAPVAPVPVVGVTHPVDASEPQPPKWKTFPLPQFQMPSFNMPNFNFFGSNRKPVKPQVVNKPGQHCQCWNTVPAVPIHNTVPEFGFPYPFRGGNIQPGNVITDPFPQPDMDINKQPQQQVNPGYRVQGGHDPQPHSGYEAPVSVGSQGEGNVRVVNSGPDTTYLESSPVPTKVVFPVSGAEDHIASETSVDSSVVTVPAPSPAPVPPTPVAAPPSSPPEPVAAFSLTPANEETPTGTGNVPPAKAIQTFSGSVPGGSTTPQEMKGKQFSIGKSKFSASTSAKSAKKPANP